MKAASLPDPGWWGATGPLHPLLGGTRARVFRAGDVVIKSTTHSEPSLRWLLPVLEAAGRAGMPGPKPIPTRNGPLVQAGWMAEPFVDGAPAVPTQIPGFAARLKRFHRATRRMPMRPGCPGAVDRGSPKGIPQPVLDQLWTSLDRHAGPICAVHGDLNASNLWLGPHGLTVLDWDEARRDHALFDRMPAALSGDATASLAWEIIACWHPEPLRARRLSRMLLRGQVRRFLADSLMASYWPEGRKRQR